VGPRSHAARKLKARLLADAAHDLKIPPEDAVYNAGDAFDRTDLDRAVVTVLRLGFHLMAIDPELGKREIRRYVVGHDLGAP
jgi:hypothetical protein